ncbi:hypothetical protein NHH03_20740 [Stieleria sp. TO1_6]|uniref:hypothetical protein n=1 Tax=Stieleria tagensis TaxID=2956795 RepID=UPI00209BB8BC|nr:hypothetical protein [Stieleria tagensis]MCO8124184.1 hypothetical protein [Stieleria tagensis]
MNSHRLFIATLIFVGLQSVASAQTAWKDYYQRRAEQDYELVLADQQSPLVLKPEAIVNWTNPLEQGQINGSTFVWENEGRPIVVGQLFSYLIGDDIRSLCHVFTTLSDRQVTGRRNGEVFWQPTPSEKSSWHAFETAPAPASNRAARLLQMRNLARQFSAYTDEASRGKRDLRLLPQPLYRSDETITDYDAGLFAYVVGTDPELLILIECAATQKESSWRYRFVQSTQSTTVATLKNEQVYHYEKSRHDPGSPNASYLSRHGIEIIDAELK